MTMSVTVSRPVKLTVEPKHVIQNRTMVNIEEADNGSAVLFWVSPDVAAQWIEALTPLAEGTK